MDKVLVNEFSEILHSTLTNTVVMKWKPNNRHMSELEFRELLNTLFCTAKDFKAFALYIDAYDFNYPFLESTIILVKTYLDTCPVKIFGFVKSQHLMGQIAIRKLIKNISISDCQLIIIDTREEGELWFKALIVMNSTKERDNQ
jgi:hypothetical protein